MNNYLPSKRFLYILGSIILAGLIIFAVGLLADWQSNKNQSNSESKIAAENKKNITYQEFMAIDSDGDGLKDWEEALWKTNPQKPDTDSDGTSDGDEVKNNRDPIISNEAKVGQEPTDKIDEKAIADQKKTEEDFNKLSDTDKMGRVLFSEYLANKKVGQTMTETDIANIINNAISTIPAPVFTQYSLKNLEIYQNENSNDITIYATQITEAINSHRPAVEIDFNQIVNSITENDTDDQIRERFSALNPLIDSYHKIALDLLKIRVPSKYADVHLSLVNAFEQLSENLSQIYKSVGDPIKMLSLINVYPDSLKKLDDVSYRFSVL